MSNLTFSMENYLEAVYELSGGSGGARLSDIADRLGVSKASVHSAMNALHQRGLVTNERYRAICLTPEGLRLAQLTAEKHHILQTLLAKVMGVEPEQANADACAMEHVISQTSAQCIRDYLAREGIELL